MASHISLLITVGVTTVIWIATTLLTRPTDRATLTAFYGLVRPAGPGWADIRRETGLPPSPDSLPQSMLGWVLGCLLVYSALFGTGSFIYGKTTQGFVWAGAFVMAAVGLVRLLPRMWRSQPAAGARG